MSNFRVAGLLTLILLSVVIGSTFCDAASRSGLAEPATDLRQPPSKNYASVVVHLGLYVSDIPMIDEAAEDFEIQGYLYGWWHDDRLIGDPRCLNKTLGLGKKEVWNPDLDIANLSTFKSFNSYFFCNPDGIVSWEEHFDAILSNEYYLRRFPFDRQVLVITIQPFISPVRGSENPIDFGAKSYTMGISPSTYLSAWKIQKITYRRGLERTNVASKVIPQAWFAIVVERRSAFYAWKVFLPLALMVIVPWTVFWISAKEFDWQMKIPIASMLTVVAFDFAISRDLPRLGYLTFLDAVFLTSFVFIFFTIIEVITVHVLVMSEKLEVAKRVHKSSRWIFPLALVLVLAALLPIFLVGAGRPQ